MSLQVFFVRIAQVLLLLFVLVVINSKPELLYLICDHIHVMHFLLHLGSYVILEFNDLLADIVHAEAFHAIND